MAIELGVDPEMHKFEWDVRVAICLRKEMQKSNEGRRKWNTMSYIAKGGDAVYMICSMTSRAVDFFAAFDALLPLHTLAAPLPELGSNADYVTQLAGEAVKHGLRVVYTDHSGHVISGMMLHP